MDTEHVTIRLFQPDEAALYKKIRLLALATDPNVFGSNLAKEEAHPDTHWREGLADPDTVAIFGVFHDAEMIGMTGIALLRDDPATAKRWGSWLIPVWRRRGLSVPMYEARLDWARRHQTVRRVIVSHRESNTASRAANQKHGFCFTHKEMRDWPDGSHGADVFYEYILDK